MTDAAQMFEPLAAEEVAAADRGHEQKPKPVPIVPVPADAPPMQYRQPTRGAPAPRGAANLSPTPCSAWAGVRERVSGQLPALPKAGVAVSADDVQRWENQVASIVARIEDMAQLDEWRKQAAALEAYLRGKEMQRPMLGAQRRIEGRIGQLLGEPKQGRPKDEKSHRDEIYHSQDRENFRLLARPYPEALALGDLRFLHGN